jgi:hypothetical protein
MVTTDCDGFPTMMNCPGTDATEKVLLPPVSVILPPLGKKAQ